MEYVIHVKAKVLKVADRPEFDAYETSSLGEIYRRRCVRKMRRSSGAAFADEMNQEIVVADLCA